MTQVEDLEAVPEVRDRVVRHAVAARSESRLERYDLGIQ
jgi:hypothetical protein